jgi:putative ABC transport system ATP-binding protein
LCQKDAAARSHAIHIRQLRYAYRRGEAPLLTIPEWQVAAGEQVFVQGASGSGKSTLLHLLSGIIAAPRGCIEVLGQDPGALSGWQRDRFRARHIGVIFQQFNLISYLNGIDNIRLASSFSGTRLPASHPHLQHLLQALALDAAVLARPVSTLSVGQQQRVAIARALINAPQLLLADEPTSALDAANTHAFVELLASVCRAVGAALVFVSHDLALASRFSRCDRMEQINRPASSAEVPVCG